MPKTAPSFKYLWKKERVGKNYKYITIKKLGQLNLKAERMLSHEELVNFRGGSGGLNCTDPKKEYWCTCTGSVGTWQGCYSSQSDADNSIITWCASGKGDCVVKPD